jgi:uncharacterized protein (TIGR00290 family)
VTKRPRTLLSWSSGKDSAWALHELRQQGDVEVVGLVTTVNQRYGRVAMHAVRQALLEAQAAAAGLPLWIVPIPSPCTNEEYAAAMRQLITRAQAADVEQMAFGDLFLEDIREYRVRMLEGTGLRPIFPLWRRPTAALACEMIAGGLQARLTCVDPKQLPADFAGRAFNAALLDDLPASVDPCGERGEFHSFAWDGPMFAHPVPIQVGEVVTREGFVFADLLPV